MPRFTSQSPLRVILRILRVGAAIGSHEHVIVADHFNVLKHARKVACNCNLMDRVRKFAVFDPKARNSTRIVTRSRCSRQTRIVRQHRDQT